MSSIIRTTGILDLYSISVLSNYWCQVQRLTSSFLVQQRVYTYM